MSAAENPERYVTEAELRPELPFNEMETPGTDTVRRALATASELVETWGDTVYQTETVTVSHARPAHVAERELPLPERPVNSVTSVSVNGTPLDAEDYRATETHLTLTPSADIDEWPTEAFSVEVAYSYGFEECPEPVREAVIRLARSSLSQIDEDGLSSESVGDHSESYRPPASVKRECVSVVRNHEAPSYYGGAIAI